MSHTAVMWFDERHYFELKEPKLREVVRWRERGRCFYCRRKLHRGWHLDHVWPRSRGGTNSLSNYVAACQDCNLGKHARILPNAALIQADLASFEAALLEEWRPYFA